MMAVLWVWMWISFSCLILFIRDGCVEMGVAMRMIARLDCLGGMEGYERWEGG